jgi:hypothetical protein
MKFGVLKSVAHNIADSLASGIGLMIGVYEMDIFGEASHSPERFIDVDFLTGKTMGGRPSRSLSRAIKLYAEALPTLCEKHAINPNDFRELTVRYSAGRFIVTVEDIDGRRSVDEYEANPGRRPRVLDPLGRIRRKKGTLSRRAAS